MRALKIEDTNADVYSAILSQRKYFCLIIFDVDSLFFFFLVAMARKTQFKSALVIFREN